VSEVHNKEINTVTTAVY